MFVSRRLALRSALPALLLPLVLAALAAGCGPDRGVRVVLITFDTLRYDAFAPDGAMPLTRERLADGLEFERSYSATSTTQPTHATLFTGLHPWVHGVVRNGRTLAAEFVTVPEILREEGFDTAAVVGAFPVAARFGFDQGFDRYDEEFSKGMFKRGWAGHDVAEGKFYSLAEDVVRRASETLDGFTSSRQFLWVHFFDPHDPYGDTTDGEPLGPAEILRLARDEPESVERRVAEARRLYLEDVVFLDRSVDRLLQRLEEDEDRYETHLVVTADHGEALGEHGSVGHGKRLLPSQIHVPLVLLSPAVEGGRRDTVVGSIDVAPTLLSLSGADRAAVEALEAGGGRDLTEPRVPSRAAGMRRTYAPRAVEARLDGSHHPIGEPQFYVVGEDGRILRGNGDGLQAPLGAPPGGSALDPARLTEVFAGFEQRLTESASDEPLEPEVMRGLGALGYVD